MAEHPDPAGRPGLHEHGNVADPETVGRAIGNIHRPVFLIQDAKLYHLAETSPFLCRHREESESDQPAAACAPPCPLKYLGNSSFGHDYRLDYPYVLGSMANGLSSVQMVEAAARAGMLGFFGAGGLTVAAVEKAVVQLQEDLGDSPYGLNLIHSPNEPELEAALVDLYIRRGVHLVEASAYMDLTLPLVRYRLHGLYSAPDGRVMTPNRIIAKASRVEVATKFFSPPPERFIKELLARGEISPSQAEMAKDLPMAQDLTAEADSGGHTDNRPAITLFPTMITVRDRMQAKFNYRQPLRVGAAGGIATPASAAAAWSMGAAYVLTGSINQSARESGTCPAVRAMLAKAGQADVTMAPAADMFEMGVKVQVLKWGTMFPMRAAKLFDLYSRHDSWENLPSADRDNLQKNFFRTTYDQVWAETQAYFLDRDQSQVRRAERDSKHRLALVFRWYLGQAAHWANSGRPDRQMDYQIFCGPAMGAFNEWVKGSFLDPPENRDVVTLAMNILYGSAVLTRVGILARQGVILPATPTPPLTLAEIQERLT